MARFLRSLLFMVPVLRLRRNTHCQEYASFLAFWPLAEGVELFVAPVWPPSWHWPAGYVSLRYAHPNLCWLLVGFSFLGGEKRENKLELNSWKAVTRYLSISTTFLLSVKIDVQGWSYEKSQSEELQKPCQQPFVNASWEGWIVRDTTALLVVQVVPIYSLSV